MRGGMEGSVDQFEEFYCDRHGDFMCAYFGIFDFVLWQSHSSSPTIPTDPELLEQEWEEEHGTGGSASGGGSGGSGATDANGNAIAGSSSGSGGSSGNTGSGSGGSSGNGSASADKKPIKEEDMKPFKGHKADPYMRILAGGVYTWM